MDPIANFLTSIRNGYLARKPIIRVPETKFNAALAAILSKEGYLGSIRPITDETTTDRTVLEIELNYLENIPAVIQIRRLSKPGRRLYVSYQQIPKPRTGIGTIILSTPAGLMTGRRAQKDKFGGELICEIIRGGSQ